jgi:hypothetical protein
MGEIIDEIRLLTRFTELFQNVTKNNYSANTNSHTPQFTTARKKSPQSAVSSPVVTS